MDTEFRRTFRWWLARPLSFILAMFVLLFSLFVMVGGIAQGVGSGVCQLATWICNKLMEYQRYVNYVTSRAPTTPVKQNSVEYGEDVPWGHP